MHAGSEINAKDGSEEKKLDPQHRSVMSLMTGIPLVYNVCDVYIGLDYDVPDSLDIAMTVIVFALLCM